MADVSADVVSSVSSSACTAFEGNRRIAAGTLPDVALVVKRTLDRGSSEPVLIYEDGTGRLIDVDTRGADADIIARLIASTPTPTPASPASGLRRGRPRLGVIAREVTLLPRHWDWLATQPGGASVTLRKLVEVARRAPDTADRRRRAQEAAYRFMSSMAGDLAGFEEAARALFASDLPKFREIVSAWPADIGDHAAKLADADQPSDLK